VICAGAWSVTAGRLTIGELLAFLTYVTQLYSPLRELAGLAVSSHAAAASAERLAEVLDEPPALLDQRPVAVAPVRRIEGAVSFREVSFRYPGADRDALQSVSFDATPGMVTAVVGPSGSGKSTLAMLLMRWADPDSGSVHLDGHDLRTLPLATVRGATSLLLQESYLFDGSIADNIRYPGDRAAAGSVELGRVLHEADVWDVVDTRTAGLDHAVGPKGATLSVGQRRRVALARALLHRRPILVLDEFSAGLDPASVRRILAAVRKHDRTVVLVTHDPVVAAAADRVVVLDGGRVRSADWIACSEGATA
jgi:ATP-binding cassette subfamily B protein